MYCEMFPIFLFFWSEFAWWHQRGTCKNVNLCVPLVSAQTESYEHLPKNFETGRATPSVKTAACWPYGHAKTEGENVRDAERVERGLITKPWLGLFLNGTNIDKIFILTDLAFETPLRHFLFCIESVSKLVCLLCKDDSSTWETDEVGLAIVHMIYSVHSFCCRLSYQIKEKDYDCFVTDFNKETEIFPEFFWKSIRLMACKQ